MQALSIYGDINHRVILGLMVTYKVSESMVSAVLPVFLRGPLHLSLTAIGGLYKTGGLLAACLGGWMAGCWVSEARLAQGLRWGAWAQIFALLPLLWLSLHPQVEWPIVATIIMIDQWVVGASAVLLVTWLPTNALRVCR